VGHQQCIKRHKIKAHFQRLLWHLFAWRPKVGRPRGSQSWMEQQHGLWHRLYLKCIALRSNPLRPIEHILILERPHSNCKRYWCQSSHLVGWLDPWWIDWPLSKRHQSQSYPMAERSLVRARSRIFLLTWLISYKWMGPVWRIPPQQRLTGKYKRLFDCRHPNNFKDKFNPSCLRLKNFEYKSISNIQGSSKGHQQRWRKTKSELNKNCHLRCGFWKPRLQWNRRSFWTIISVAECYRLRKLEDLVMASRYLQVWSGLLELGRW
jgi:hypothetical protein